MQKDPWGRTTLTRQELYDLVWKTPSVRVAQALGLSDVALGKACKRYNIPKPPLGYWAKVESGHKVSRPKLPSFKMNSETVTIGGSRREEMEPSTPEIERLVAEEGRPENRILVSETLVEPHPLVRKTMTALRRGNPDEYGRVRSGGEEFLDVLISKKSIDRAARVLDAIVRAFEKRGYPVSVVVTPNRYYSTVQKKVQVTVRGEPITIRMEEPTVRFENPPSERKTYQYRPRWIFSPTGRLNLIIDHTPGWSSFRRQWTDSPKHPIEGQLNSFVIGILRVSDGFRLIREKEAKEERARQEHAIRQAEAERLLKEEEARIRDFENKLSDWEKSKRARMFLVEIERAAVKELGSINPSSELGKWLCWAKKRANSISPLPKMLKMGHECSAEQSGNDR